ncbi:MAG: NADH-quinone oxidoreductase subunit C [Pirellulales bacterium]
MTLVSETRSIRNGERLALAKVPQLPLGELQSWLDERIAAGGQLSALFGVPLDSTALALYAVTTAATSGTIAVAETVVKGRYPALTPRVPQAHWFEREIAEQWGVVPEGHPWLKPIRFHASYASGRDAWNRAAGEAILPGVTDYFRVEGEEIHEVAVGPVHAGVIEPGHFRFQCHGEHVFTLEIELGYQHRGIERQLVGGPTKRTLHYMETLAGDTTIGHAAAYSQAVEGLSGSAPPLRAQAIRVIALELERLANHVGDLGALAQDVGYLPTASYCGRLRGDFLNATAMICGNRFGRGTVRPGGVGFDIDESLAKALCEKVEAALRDVEGATRLLWTTSSVMARFEETGRVSRATASELGLVGPAARACGIDRDIRRDFPSGYYRFAQLPVSTWHSGDAFARAYLRWLEVNRSARFIIEQLRALPHTTLRAEVGPLEPNSLVVALVEGWRGEICHVALTDDDGRFAHYKVVDPSFHNWIGLAMSLRDQQISDFPLCNKSFNLSYCGHDL